jgi:hypothetical protein
MKSRKMIRLSRQCTPIPHKYDSAEAVKGIMDRYRNNDLIHWQSNDVVIIARCQIEILEPMVTSPF